MITEKYVESLLGSIVVSGKVSVEGKIFGLVIGDKKWGHHWTDICVEVMMSEFGKKLGKHLDQAKNPMKVGSWS